MKSLYVFLAILAALVFLAPIKLSVPALVAAWLKREHILDLITGQSPRFDALLRTLGLRTHKTPVPVK